MSEKSNAKILFAPVKVKLNLDDKKIIEISKKLPKNIAIAYSVQYRDIALQIKKILSLKAKKKITKFTQVLGCSIPAFKTSLEKSTQGIFLITDGEFHAVSLAMETGIPVYTPAMPSFSKINKVSEKEIEDLRKKKKASYMKFLNADKVGILVSIKPGQQHLKKALSFKKRLKDKKAYIFLADNIDTKELENFPDIDVWVNTACPRIDFNIADSVKIINLKDILDKV